MKFGIRTTGLALACAMALAGCGSTTKLDEAPVESRTPSAVDAGAGGKSAQPGAGVAAPQSQVAAVNLAGGSAGSALGRVVLFDFDSFVVKEDYRPMIEAYAKQLSAAKSKRMLVEGHTDERGGSEYNLALGQKRADSVVKSMELLGAGNNQLEAVSFGKERPASDGHDEAAWAKNRRAELKDR